jgi:hypothetical protein
MSGGFPCVRDVGCHADGFPSVRVLGTERAGVFLLFATLVAGGIAGGRPHDGDFCRPRKMAMFPYACAMTTA